MKVGTPVLTISLCLMGATAQADSGTSPSVQTQQTKSRNDPDRMVCRTEYEIGSLVHKTKTCMTVAQWRELSAQTGAATEKYQAQNAKPGGT